VRLGFPSQALREINPGTPASTTVLNHDPTALPSGPPGARARTSGNVAGQDRYLGRKAQFRRAADSSAGLVSSRPAARPSRILVIEILRVNIAGGEQSGGLRISSAMRETPPVLLLLAEQAILSANLH
jgi:hypothetical protein